MKRQFFVMFFSLVGLSHASAYECVTTIEATSPVQQFLLNSDGTVTDLRYGLQWERCSYGQTYDQPTNTCLGEPKEVNSWSDALMLQHSVKSAGQSDWRLPSIKELQSIVERQCRQPAVNTNIFLGTANAAYWSNTYDDTVNPQLEGRIIDFSDGVEFARPTNTKYYVRMVREIGK